jgi:hypothetical protein
MLLRMRVLFLMKWAQDRMLAASIALATIMVGSMSVLLFVCEVRCEVSLFTSIQIQIEFSVHLAGCI